MHIVIYLSLFSVFFIILYYFIFYIRLFQILCIVAKWRNWRLKIGFKRLAWTKWARRGAKWGARGRRRKGGRSTSIRVWIAWRVTRGRATWSSIRGYFAARIKNNVAPIALFALTRSRTWKSTWIESTATLLTTIVKCDR